MTESIFKNQLFKLGEGRHSISTFIKERNHRRNVSIEASEFRFQTDDLVEKEENQSDEVNQMEAPTSFEDEKNDSCNCTYTHKFCLSSASDFRFVLIRWHLSEPVLKALHHPVFLSQLVRQAQSIGDLLSNLFSHLVFQFAEGFAKLAEHDVQAAAFVVGGHPVQQIQVPVFQGALSMGGLVKLLEERDLSGGHGRLHHELRRTTRFHQRVRQPDPREHIHVFLETGGEKGIIV